MKARLLTLITGSLLLLPATAQKRETFEQYRQRKQAEFNQFRERKQKEFDDYRKKKNAEFANFLGKPWQPFDVQEGIPEPKSPDPVAPPVAPAEEPTTPPTPIEIPQGEVMPIDIPVPEPPLDIPIPEKTTNQNLRTVDLFSTPVEVEIDPSLKFKMNGVGEKEITRIWKLLSRDAYTPLFLECARQMSELQLNGWAVFQLCKVVSEELEGKGTNEAVLLQTYLLSQLGYDARMARVNNNRLAMLCPADVNLAGISYLPIDGRRFYLWADISQDVQVFCYELNYEDATRPIDFSNAMAIQLDNTTLPAQTFTSEWDKDASVKVNVRKSLMDYYADIPSITNYSFYANQPMDAKVSRQVLPPLRNALMGKTELEAANLLLHFVQTAFKYATDEEQFGHEKTYFKEELFYYRASDCEDRAILFSELVKQLMGLDVVLLTYPMHMCTAVKFTEDIMGDYVMVDGTKYIICDPTYINANAGMCIEEYKTVSPTIYKVRR